MSYKTSFWSQAKAWDLKWNNRFWIIWILATVPERGQNLSHADPDVGCVDERAVYWCDVVTTDVMLWLKLVFLVPAIKWDKKWERHVSHLGGWKTSTDNVWISYPFASVGAQDQGLITAGYIASVTRSDAPCCRTSNFTGHLLDDPMGIRFPDAEVVSNSLWRNVMKSHWWLKDSNGA